MQGLRWSRLQPWQRQYAWCPANTVPLTEYTGARIGSSTGTMVDMAETKAYGQAVNDAQRKYIVDELLVKYSL